MVLPGLTLNSEFSYGHPNGPAPSPTWRFIGPGETLGQCRSTAGGPARKCGFRLVQGTGLRNATEVISRRRPGMDHLRLEEATSQLK